MRKYMAETRKRSKPTRQDGEVLWPGGGGGALCTGQEGKDYWCSCPGSPGGLLVVFMWSPGGRDRPGLRRRGRGRLRALFHRSGIYSSTTCL